MRIMVMGPPGSGKSTLARRLAAEHGIPVFHLDQAYWRPGWVEAPVAEFHAEVARITALPDWVIDGNYTSTIEGRLAVADRLIYLDVPPWRCALRILRRIAASHGQVRPDMAEGCREQFSLAFLHFAWTWHRTRRTRNLALVEAFPRQKEIRR